MKYIFSEIKTILQQIVSLFRGKFALYSCFYTLWTLFILYNNNFFHPACFWMFFAFYAMAVVPVFFVISIEEKQPLIKVSYIVLALSAGTLLFLSSHRGVVREFLSQSVPAYTAIGVSVLAIAVYCIIKRNFFLKEYGFSTGDKPLAISLTLISIAVMIPIIIIASRNPSFHSVYPLFKIMNKGGMTFVVYEVYFLVFFFMWEFFFRGIMLFSLRKNSENIYIAVIMQAVIFAFAHMGKPGLETFSSLFGGILLGIIILRLRTFLPAAIIHFVIALTMDIIAVFF